MWLVLVRGTAQPVLTKECLPEPFEGPMGAKRKMPKAVRHRTGTTQNVIHQRNTPREYETLTVPAEGYGTNAHGGANARGQGAWPARPVPAGGSTAHGGCTCKFASFIPTLLAGLQLVRINTLNSFHP